MFTGVNIPIAVLMAALRMKNVKNPSMSTTAQARTNSFLC
jgi:uncharacterized protein